MSDPKQDKLDDNKDIYGTFILFSVTSTYGLHLVLVRVNTMETVTIAIKANATLKDVREHKSIGDYLQNVEQQGKLNFVSVEGSPIAREFEDQNYITRCVKEGKIDLIFGMRSSEMCLCVRFVVCSLLTSLYSPAECVRSGSCRCWWR